MAPDTEKGQTAQNNPRLNLQSLLFQNADRCLLHRCKGGEYVLLLLTCTTTLPKTNQADREVVICFMRMWVAGHIVLVYI